jgi:peptidoglycan/LPS O-acetylase OafA/YrhL
VVLALWGRHRLRIAVGVAVLLAVATWWRWHVYRTEGWYSASLRTSTRVDAALYGVLAALLWDKLAMIRRDATAILGASTLVILGVIFSASRFGIDAYFGWQGVAIAVASTLFVVAASADQVHDHPATRLFNLKPLRVLGSSSLTLYVWHLPLFHAITRHTPTWDPSARATLAVALLAAVTVVLHRWVDEPLKRWTGRIGRTRTAVAADA